MPPISPQGQPPSIPHPLALQLIERLRHDRCRGRILDFAAGSGRNSRALAAAGCDVVAIADPQAYGESPFDGIDEHFVAAISTHGFLHGTQASIEKRLHAVAQRLEAPGLLYATFGSIRDSRFGTGTRIDDRTFAPANGDERGVAHAYYDRADLEGALGRSFVIESLEERGVDEIAGAWAHRERPLAGAVHWLAIARRNQ